MIAYQAKLMDQGSEQASAAIAGLKQTLWIVGLIAIAIAVAAVMSYWVIRSITRPLSEAVELSLAVADGDLSTRFEPTGKIETAQLLIALKNTCRPAWFASSAAYATAPTAWQPPVQRSPRAIRI